MPELSRSRRTAAVASPKADCGAAEQVAAPKRRGRPPLARNASGEYVPDDIRGAVARLKRERIVASAVGFVLSKRYRTFAFVMMIAFQLASFVLRRFVLDIGA